MNAKEARRLSEEARNTAVERYNIEVDKVCPKALELIMNTIKERSSNGDTNVLVDFQIFEDSLLASMRRPEGAKNPWIAIEAHLTTLGFKFIYSLNNFGHIVDWSEA